MIDRAYRIFTMRDAYICVYFSFAAAENEWRLVLLIPCVACKVDCLQQVRSVELGWSIYYTFRDRASVSALVPPRLEKWPFVPLIGVPLYRGPLWTVSRCRPTIHPSRTGNLGPDKNRRRNKLFISRRSRRRLPCWTASEIERLHK